VDTFVWVVKLGGSLSKSEALRGWLAVMARAGRGGVVVVPGGGRYADAVRAEQQRWEFDDGAAHSMALLAMDQYGHQLIAIGNQAAPRAFEAACINAEIRSVLGRGAVAVWIGSRIAESDATLPRDWGLTSDSLAAWLARGLNASGLALIKSVRVDETEIGAAQLVAREWVDARFPEFLLGAHFETRLFGEGQEVLLEQTLLGTAAGARVAP
jgi:aspartokinase-like uncharacterized kinase